MHFGVSLATATWLVTIQVLAGLVSPLGGLLGDRFGHRTTMLAGLLVALVGMVLAALAPRILLVVAALGLVGIGTVLYNPSMQAYVSELTPFARRGRALGAVELSWSLAGIVAVPLLIALAERTGSLQMPFALLAVLTGLALALSVAMLPSEAPRQHAANSAQMPLRLVLGQPTFLALILFLWLGLVGQEVLFSAQAPWLTQHLGASAQDVANALFVFGVGELVGAALATVFTDRLGKLRAPLIGFGAAALIYVLLPVVARSWSSYLPLFAAFGLLFEFAIVSSFSVASAVNPRARGTVMAGAMTATQIGRAAGSWFGVRLYESTNFLANGLVAAVLTLIAVVVAMIGVRPQENEVETTESEAVRIL
jgi:predicted MFS family arabinose efflux permease